jgi:hypothetical protein
MEDIKKLKDLLERWMEEKYGLSRCPDPKCLVCQRIRKLISDTEEALKE